MIGTEKAITVKELGAKQRETLDWVCREMQDNGYKEIKKMEITRFEGANWVLAYIVSGLKNDEKTMASVFCRNKRHFRIGKNGGLTLLNGKRRNIRGRRALWAATN